MMQPAAALLQEARDAAFRVNRFEQLDLASVRTAEREKCYTHPFPWEVENPRRLDSQRVAVELERGFQVAHHHGDMVNALDTLGEHGLGIPSSGGVRHTPCYVVKKWYALR